MKNYLAWSAIAVFAVVLLQYNITPQTTQDETINVNKEQEYWSNNITAINDKQISKLFQKKYRHLNPEEQHLIAHIMGEAFYKKWGSSGILRCDHSIGNTGCMHEVVTRAIFEKGLGILSSLNETCLNLLSAKQISSCQHGIGHGILFYLGHTYENLLGGLAQCAQLIITYSKESTRYVEGCMGGVFMEYNSNPSFNVTGEQRIFKEDTIYAPCNSIQETLRPICYFWQTQWWNTSLKNQTDVIKYKKMGELCVAIRDANEQMWCFRGIAHTMIPDTHWSPRQAIHLCGVIMTERGREECFVYADYLFQDEGLKSVCENLGTKEEKRCFKNASMLITNGN